MVKLSNTPSVIFENEDYLVLNKPRGMSVHLDGKTDTDTLVDWLLLNYPDIKDVGEPLVLESGEEILRPGIVHRLDKDTTGLLLIAKTPESYEFFKEKFKEREIQKTYFAFVYGKPRDARGIVDLPIGRAQGSVRKWETGSRVRGETREAQTRYKVLQSGHGATFLEIWPKTGRTHQIRVHMKAIGHPIVADSLYAPTKKPILGFKRLALHAGRLVFNDLSGRERVFEAPLPPDFKTAAEEIGFNLPK